MKFLKPDDHEMLERLITFCRAASVAADSEQAASARRVEHFLTQTLAQISSHASQMASAPQAPFSTPNFRP